MYMCDIFFEGKNCQKEYNIFQVEKFSYLVPLNARANDREREKNAELKETNYLLTKNQNSEHHFTGSVGKNLTSQTFLYLFGVPLKLIHCRIPSFGSVKSIVGNCIG